MTILADGNIWKAFESPSMNMNFITVSERDGDGVWIAQCPAICGCVRQGATRKEALARIFPT